MSTPARPSWMSRVLLLAAAYNIGWGAAVVLAPGWTSGLVGLDPAPRYPELWQCIGMIVGVYGVGYWIASRDPMRHWPIVLVGLLGKVFGPIGLAWSLYRGALPLQMLWTIVFNDLIWWIPFAGILWQAVRVSSASGVFDGPATRTLQDQHGRTVADHSSGRDFLLVFLRHSGCTFCREAIADVARVRSQIEESGVGIGFVYMGDADRLAAMAGAAGLDDLPRFRDPLRQLYAEFQLGVGTFAQLFGVRTFLRGFRAAILDRHGFGWLDGSGLQMPGAFLVRDGRIVTAYRHTTASDRPDYVQICGLKPAVA